MILTAICPACAVVRARTGDLPRGTRASASDFIPEPGQEQPVDGKPALCTACGTSLAFRWLPMPSGNGAPEPQVDRLQTAPQVTSSTAVRTVFVVEHGEEVLHAAPVGRDKFVLVTNRRMVVLDIAAVAEGR